MHSIQRKLHIGSDGLLKVHLPEARNMDVDVVIVYRTSTIEQVEEAPPAQFYGCIQDETFLRQPQNAQPERESLE
ncbi:hypothetical protein [Gloeobacter kilaueensis]|uniref:Uncharacterized protein n=1 Tax=Gloeobacter kilaueensis (strain ATCC BAA-2537 / CCAP 1431/1 / ULC 316 / JS1) TaxID=1183438 RepID=U5QF12_GLOK1|nr:hypothetical protein [Gloeobacter kilaueensis]AGY57547.1 hypothetical protein GKIL_1301 [Gloeobacter kilaueensis JS1]